MFWLSKDILPFQLEIFHSLVIPQVLRVGVLKFSILKFFELSPKKSRSAVRRTRITRNGLEMFNVMSCFTFQRTEIFLWAIICTTTGDRASNNEIVLQEWSVLMWYWGYENHWEYLRKVLCSPIQGVLQQWVYYWGYENHWEYLRKVLCSPIQGVLQQWVYYWGYENHWEYLRKVLCSPIQGVLQQWVYYWGYENYREYLRKVLCSPIQGVLQQWVYIIEGMRTTESIIGKCCVLPYREYCNSEYNYWEYENYREYLRKVLCSPIQGVLQQWVYTIEGMRTTESILGKCCVLPYREYCNSEYILLRIWEPLRVS